MYRCTVIVTTITMLVLYFVTSNTTSLRVKTLRNFIPDFTKKIINNKQMSLINCLHLLPTGNKTLNSSSSIQYNFGLSVLSIKTTVSLTFQLLTCHLSSAVAKKVTT